MTSLTRRLFFSFVLSTSTILAASSPASAYELAAKFCRNVMVGGTLMRYTDFVRPIDCADGGVPARVHSNGGGWVALGSQVASTAYVGPNAAVSGGAIVRDNARIDEFAAVSGTATIISRYARIAGGARVYSGTVTDNAIIYGLARIEGAVVINGSAQIFENAVVNGVTGAGSGVTRITIGGNTDVRGSARVVSQCPGGATQPSVVIGGDTVITDNAFVCGIVRIEGNVTMFNNSKLQNCGILSGSIMGRTYLTDNAIVDGGITCTSTTRPSVGDFAVVEDNAKIRSGGRVAGYGRVSGCRIVQNETITGFASAPCP
jgi:carbonic anhydrase/acetyltransferase-like protein (isoleucine patch superfamily)